MAEIPDHHRARFVHEGGDLSGIEQFTCPVVDHRERHDCRGVIEVIGQLGRMQPNDFQAEQPSDRVGDVLVGGKIRSVGEQSRPPGPEPCGADQCLKELHRGGVAADHLAWCRTDQPGDLLTHQAGQLPPPVLVPARDQVAGPLPNGCVTECGWDDRGHGAEGVAVEIDGLIRQGETRPCERQLVGSIGVCCCGPVQVRGHRAPPIDRRTPACRRCA